MQFLRLNPAYKSVHSARPTPNPETTISHKMTYPRVIECQLLAVMTAGSLPEILVFSKSEMITIDH